MSKDTFYFSHDYNARSDDKIKNLIRKHGVTGYGIFWCVIEDLYNNANALRLDYEGIAYDLRADCETIKSIINNFDLFIIEDDYFGSSSVERRLDERNEKSEKARESAFKRWNRIKKDANALRTHSEGNAIKERKGKEIKESKVNINVPFSDFWNLYDKKRGERQKLEKKWNGLTDNERVEIMDYIPKYKEATPDKKFRKDPQTFLNNKSWNDEIITSDSTNTRPINDSSYQDN